MNPLILLIVPTAITMLLLTIQARWAWLRTQDKILRGMKLDEVIRRANAAKWHRLFAGIHTLAAMAGSFVLFNRVFTILDLNPYRESQTIGIFFWLYVFYVPHMLALYLYHLRWNPNTVSRKRKLDAEDVQYEGDFRLRDGVQYRLGEDGELEEVEDEMEETA